MVLQHLRSRRIFKLFKRKKGLIVDVTMSRQQVDIVTLVRYRQMIISIHFYIIVSSIYFIFQINQIMKQKLSEAPK